MYTLSTIVERLAGFRSKLLQGLVVKTLIRGGPVMRIAVYLPAGINIKPSRVQGLKHTRRVFIIEVRPTLPPTGSCTPAHLANE